MKSTHLISDNKSKERLICYIERLDEDRRWIVAVSEYKNNRTIAQNALYWMWLTVIGGDLGYSKNEMHIVFADMLLSNEVVEFRGHDRMATKSTSRLKTDEFATYLREIEMFAGGEGIVLPHPQDLYFEAMYGLKRDKERPS